MARILIFLMLMVACLFAATVSAQDKKASEPDDVVRIDTELVDVPVVVTDRAGKPVLNLKQKNFVVYEDNAKQDVTDFAATNAPFEVAVLLDTSGSTRSELDLIKRAAQQFVDSLRPGDRVSIVAFKSGVEGSRTVPAADVLCPLSSDRNVLRAAIDKMSTSNGTPYYDTLLTIASKVFADAPKEPYRGRRALVALTDGVDSTSAADFDEAKELYAKESLISFFIKVDTRPFFEEGLLGDCESAIRFSKSQIRRYYQKSFRGTDIEKVTDFCQLGDFERLAISKKLYDVAEAEMNMLAKSSGGRVFPVEELSEARLAFRSVAAEIGTKYSLGYYSSNEKRDGTFRKIRIELKDLPPGTQVRAREGYIAPLRQQ